MGRLFSVFILLAVLLCPAVREKHTSAQPVFFSMLFPQLVPEMWTEPGEAEDMLL